MFSLLHNIVKMNILGLPKYVSYVSLWIQASDYWLDLSRLTLVIADFSCLTFVPVYTRGKTLPISVFSAPGLIEIQSSAWERPLNTWYVCMSGMSAWSDCAVAKHLDAAHIQSVPTQWTPHFWALLLKPASQLTQRTIHFIPRFDRKQLKISHLCCNCYIAIFIVGTLSG